ncbi:MAG: RNA polymerase sigma factor RpoD/SigA [Gemmatimonadota bacterium]
MARSLEHYLREIGRQPLLTREEEAWLAGRIRRGDERARERLVKANLRFVVSVAKRYQNRGVPLPDLVNEGNLGLLRAAGRFDGSRGVRFISYAVWWIRQAIVQAVTRGSGRGAGSGAAPAWLSLDAPLGEGREARLRDVLADPQPDDPGAKVELDALRDALAASLTCLPEREERVLRLYFGLDGDPPRSLDQVGSELGVSRERVRQIRERALARMRLGPRFRTLEAYRRPF